MINRIFIDGIILVVVFAICWFLFGYFQKPVSLPETIMSKDYENKIGEWIEKEITSEYDVLEHSIWKDQIKEVLERIQSSSKIKEKDYKVVVLKSKDVNAFATFGNTVYFFSGLMEKIESPEQFAGILAHEIGHIEENHVQEKLMAEFGLTLIMSIISGNDPALSLQLTKEIISGSFSRSNEAEADEFALNVLHDSGIHPMHLGLIFKNLKKMQNEKYDIPLEILHSHPDLDSRIKKAFEFEKVNFEEKKFSMPWPEFEEIEEDNGYPN